MAGDYGYNPFEDVALWDENMVDGATVAVDDNYTTSPRSLSRPSLAEPRLLTGREGLVKRSCSREIFDYVIRSKRVNVRAMFSSEGLI